MGLMFVATVPYMDSHVRAFSGKACVRLMLHDRWRYAIMQAKYKFCFLPDFAWRCRRASLRKSMRPDAFTGLFRVQT